MRNLFKKKRRRKEMNCNGYEKDGLDCENRKE